MAVNCSVAPFGIEGFAGAMAIETSVAAVTVKEVEPLTDPEAAWMVVVPGARPVARPELLMLATEGFKEVQAAELVRFWVEPSV